MMTGQLEALAAEAASTELSVVVEIIEVEGV